MTFQEQPFPEHHRCTLCGTLRHAHADDGRCPVLWRHDTLEAAQVALDAAVSRHDAAAEFVARGDVQRLGGKP